MKLDKISRATSIDAALQVLCNALESPGVHLVTVERDGYGDTFWIRTRRRAGGKREDESAVGDVVADGR